MALMDDLAGAIARMENVNTAYNNPGGIWDFNTNAIKRYGTYQEGWSALTGQVSRNVNRGLTLYEFFGGQRDSSGNVIPGGYPGYAPAGHGGNDPIRYAEEVARWIGVRPDVPLNQVGGEIPAPTAPSGGSGITVPAWSGSTWDAVWSVPGTSTPEDGTSLPMLAIMAVVVAVVVFQA